jgi:hypothetical protein
MRVMLPLCPIRVLTLTRDTWRDDKMNESNIMECETGTLWYRLDERRKN